MRATLIAAILFLTPVPASAHRLDEYLQGTIISVEKNRLQAHMTLTPGVAIFPVLIPYIDADANGVISETEQRAYAGQVLHDLSLTIDGQHLTPQLVSTRFPTVDEMKEGRGEIVLDFDAGLPAGGGNRKLRFENHHQSGISAYQVNSLVPRDPDIRIAAQDRNYSQSLYQLEYVQTGAPSDAPTIPSWSNHLEWLAAMALLLFTRLAFLWRERTSA
jgi:hypothetical protein